jgi:hypothetical protein
MNYGGMEEEIKNLKEEGITLKTQISEMRQSESRLFSLVVTVAFILIAGSFWYNNKVYEIDKRVLQDDLTKAVVNARGELVKEHSTAIDKKFEELKKKLLEEDRNQFHELERDVYKSLADVSAFTLGEVIKIRLDRREVVPAIRAGVDQFNHAINGKGTYWADALDNLVPTIERENQICIPATLLDEVEKIADFMVIRDVDRGKRLKAAIESYRAKKLCP